MTDKFTGGGLDSLTKAAYQAGEEDGAAVERYAILELLFEYEGRPDLTDDDLSLLKHLAELIAERGEQK